MGIQNTMMIETVPAYGGSPKYTSCFLGHHRALGFKEEIDEPVD
jgi:hypothetical protein